MRKSKVDLVKDSVRGFFSRFSTRNKSKIRMDLDKKNDVNSSILKKNQENNIEQENEEILGVKRKRGNKKIITTNYRRKKRDNYDFKKIDTESIEDEDKNCGKEKFFSDDVVDFKDSEEFTVDYSNELEIDEIVVIKERNSNVKIEISNSIDYIPMCFGKVLPENKCIRCFWMVRCFYINLNSSIETFKKENYSSYVDSKSKIYNFSFIINDKDMD